MPRYAELVYNGFWFSPERRALQAAIDETQKYCTGTVRVKLYKVRDLEEYLLNVCWSDMFKLQHIQCCSLAHASPSCSASLDGGRFRSRHQSMQSAVSMACSCLSASAACLCLRVPL